jgi:two-component system, cell cycle sensor histidine kinase and response regulator CckA
MATRTQPRRRRAASAAPGAVAASSPTWTWDGSARAEVAAIRAALDALPVGLVFAECMAGNPATVVGHNAAYGRIVGTRPDDRTPYADLPYNVYRPDRMTRVPPEEWPAPRAARTGDKVAELELHLRRADGAWRVLAVSAAPLPRSEDEQASRAVGIVLDVTDRRRAEDDLSQRGQILRHVIDASTDPVFAKDREGRVLFANPAMLRALGKIAAEVMGRTNREYFPDPSMGQAIYSEDRRVMESGVEEVVEEVVPGPEGRRVFLSTKTPWRDSAGRVIGLVAIARDITERKQAEDALRRSERRFRTLIETSCDMLLLVDAEGRYRHWSPAAAEALGWTEEEVVGTRAIDLVHPDDREEVARAFAAVSTRSGAPVRHRARMRRKDGTWRLVEGVGRDLLSDEDIRSVVLNVRDVTEQQRTEEQLLQSQKLESIGRLAGGIAHDFNNLLTVILCSAESEGEALDAGRSVEREDVDQIREAGARARDLTRDLLAFARREGAAPTTLDLNALLGGSDKLLRRVIREDIHLETGLQPGIWPVRCDPAQLEQVILNLAVNARDAMSSGGRLRLATANVRIEPEHPDLPAGDWVRLRIQDDGAGMSREVKEHLFEPFFTTKPAGQGTGLGLSTVYGIVRQAGGHVRVESEPGEGSIFDVYLPRDGDTAAARPETAQPRAASGTETVLLVEDDPGVREATQRALRAAGYRVLAAPGAEGALEVLKTGGTPPALLVTDVIMPAMSGPDLAARVRARFPAMRVLYLSGYAHGVIGPHGVLDPGVAFLPKPFTPRSLLARVREVLDGP